MGACLLTRAEKQKIFIDTNRCIKSGSLNDWTATEDCFVIAVRANTTVYLDGALIAYDNGSSFNSTTFYMKKGQKITASGGWTVSNENCRVYGLRS